MPDLQTESILQKNVAAASATFTSLLSISPEIRKAGELIGACLTSGNKLMTCGNGGSAADASHFATEFVCRFQSDRLPRPAISLCDSSTSLTAIGNDYGFDQVFARQLRAFARPGDVLIALTTSGQSRNIILALQAAKDLDIRSIAFLGKGGGAARGLATVDLIVPSQTTPRIQEAHVFLYHCLCEMVEPLIGSR